MTLKILIEAFAIMRSTNNAVLTLLINAAWVCFET